MRPVLVAVDVSWDSRAALLWACRHAAIVDAPVTVLHVLHDPAETPGKYRANASNLLAPMSDTAEKMLSEFMAEVRETHSELKRLCEARAETMSGLPAQTIVGEAVRLDALLIVVGSRGHTGLPRLMHGSTAQRVVQLSPIPVTVVKAG
jgi:nucleotide-binding universal stress UspA family protein